MKRHEHQIRLLLQNIAVMHSWYNNILQ